MPKIKEKLKLSEEAKCSLTAMLHKGVHSAREMNRARILLKLDEGLGAYQIAKQLSVCPATVYNIQDRCQQEGYQSALKDKARPGKPRGIHAKTRAAITSLACSDPPEGYSQWSLRLLADKVVELEILPSVSYSTVNRILKKTS